MVRLKVERLKVERLKAEGLKVLGIFKKGPMPPDLQPSALILQPDNNLSNNSVLKILGVPPPI